MNAATRPLPHATVHTEPFWQAALEGRLVVQRCVGCGRLQFYPRAFCLSCMREDLEWHPCSGYGSIYTYTVNHRAANAYMKDRLPYAVAVVALDEGPRMMTNIVNTPLEKISIGMRVRAVFERVDARVTLVQFEAVDRADAT